MAGSVPCHFSCFATAEETDSNWRRRRGDELPNLQSLHSTQNNQNQQHAQDCDAYFSFHDFGSVDLLELKPAAEPLFFSLSARRRK
jgi:hypothetical protein